MEIELGCVLLAKLKWVLFVSQGPFVLTARMSRPHQDMLMLARENRRRKKYRVTEADVWALKWTVWVCVYVCVSPRWPWVKKTGVDWGSSVATRDTDLTDTTELSMYMCVWVYRRVFFSVCVYMFCVRVHPPRRFLYLPAAKYLRINPSVRTRNWRGFTTVRHTQTYTFGFLLFPVRKEKSWKKRNETILYNDAVSLFFSTTNCPWLFPVCVCEANTLTLFAHIVTAGVFLHQLLLYLWSGHLRNCCNFYDFPPDRSPFSLCLSTFMKWSHAAFEISNISCSCGDIFNCSITRFHTDGHLNSP